MTENTIACIIFLIVGIIAIIISIYQFILSIKDDKGRIILVVPFLALGALLITVSIAHWNDDDFKTIDCTSYEVEEIVTIKNDSIVETKYKIYYK